MKNIESTVAPIPVNEAIASISGNEDWTDPAVIMGAMEMMARVTDPLAYFNALPSEAQEVLNDFLSGDSQTDGITTTVVVSFGYNDGVLHYTNSGSGLDVAIDTRGVSGENSGGTLDSSTIVNLWDSTILAPVPQSYFDALPEETREAMVSALSDNSIIRLIMDTSN